MRQARELATLLQRLNGEPAFNWILKDRAWAKKKNWQHWFGNLRQFLHDKGFVKRTGVDKKMVDGLEQAVEGAHFNRREVLAGIGAVAAAAAAQYPTSALAGGAPDTIDKVYFEPTVNSPKFDLDTYWTPERFTREIAENRDQITYVHWRWQGVGDNRVGDEMVNRFVEDFPQIHRFVVVELSQHQRKHFEDLVQIPKSYNPAEGPIPGAPVGSIFRNGREFRIRGPPDNQTSYADLRQDIAQYLQHG